jgi:Amidohydrolase family
MRMVPHAAANLCACMQGFTGSLPPGHPTLRHAGVDGDTGAATRAAGAATAAALLHRPARVAFINGRLWTATQSPQWAVGLCADAESGEILEVWPAGGGALADPVKACAAAAGGPGASLNSPADVAVVELGGAFVMPVRHHWRYSECIVLLFDQLREFLKNGWLSVALTVSAAVHHPVPTLPQQCLNNTNEPQHQGFIDPHVHLIPGGLTLTSIDLRGVTGRADFAARIAAAAAAAAPGEWLTAFGWSEADWGGGLPDVAWVDEVRRCTGV